MWSVDPFPSWLLLFRSIFGLQDMMPEQLKQITPKNRRTTPILSDFHELWPIVLETIGRA